MHRVALSQGHLILGAAATLDGEAKDRYAAINKTLAGLHTNFGNNVLADEEGYVLYIKKDQLGGLSDSFIQAAAAAANRAISRSRTLGPPRARISSVSVAPKGVTTPIR